MKIAHLLPNSVQYPLETHNGRYEWVQNLAQIQASQGHEVTIYCNPKSNLDNIQIAGINDTGPDKQKNNLLTVQLALAENHDIYHSHFDNLHYNVAHLTDKPIIYTQHWWPTNETVRISQETKIDNVWAVPPTKYMYELDQKLGIKSSQYIYHGIDLTLFSVNPNQIKKNGRLLFVSRIAPEKNLDIAIEVARATGIGLDIIGKVPPGHQQYWNELQAHIDGQKIIYHGPKTHQELINYYAEATALIFPSETTEPFGLVAIEAQACGTPVIMKRGGSRGELITDNKTGFLCENIDEFKQSSIQAGELSSLDCIKQAQKFDVLDMAKNYENLYHSLLSP